MGKRALILMAMLTPIAVNAMEPVFRDVAEYVGVPAYILYAMGQAESGQYRDGAVVPWPWTLNIAGKPMRFKNRQAMFKGLMDALGTGELSIDVGPMQVNWYWHFESMGSAWRITDPAVNIKLAAEILKNQYQRCGDWWTAVGLYHRPGDSLKDRRIADDYRRRVRTFAEPVLSQKLIHDAV